jgi:hypothetical protein
MVGVVVSSDGAAGAAVAVEREWGKRKREKKKKY